MSRSSPPRLSTTRARGAWVRGRGEGSFLTRRSMLVASKMPIMIEKWRSPSTSLSMMTCCSWISLMMIRFSSMWTGTAASLSADGPPECPGGVTAPRIIDVPRAAGQASRGARASTFGEVRRRALDRRPVLAAGHRRALRLHRPEVGVLDLGQVGLLLLVGQEAPQVLAGLHVGAV